MDLSRQTNDSFAGVSMYFDADSTVSSCSAFKTLEAMSDISNVSTVGRNNSTLEATSVIFKEQTQLQVVKNLNMSNNKLTTASPLYAKSKNILQEFRAQCSTPTHAQLMRTVEVNRGSEAALCVDLGMAFNDMAVDDNMPNLINTEENKENALPDKDKESDEGSTLLTSSSVEIVTIIDRNKMTISQTDEECEEEEKAIKLTNEVNIKNEVKLEEEEEAQMKINAKDINKEVRFAENLNEKRSVPLKARRSLLPSRIVRKSVCEPDLKTNRPSRISMAATTSQRKIPLPKPILSLPAKKPEQAQAIKKPLNIVKKEEPNKNIGRQSLLPAAQAEKRAFPYASRMSVVVKTTLNSPARKLMRRSIIPPKTMGFNNAAARRSVMPAQQEVLGADTARFANLAYKRRSVFLTTNKTTTTTKITSVTATTTTSTAASVAKSMPINKKKPSSIQEFVCNVCNAKYRIKSLLDAHKRSHEDGMPAFVRKAPAHSSSNNISSNNNAAQCKYCDKKFALVRTLHIHLLENCTKIPPADKRKLAYTEMAHVEKAQLPVFTHSAQHSSQSSSASSLMMSKSHSTLSTSDSLADKNDAAVIARDLVNALKVLEISPPQYEEKQAKMAPPSSTKVKKNTAHMGVYRTPTKSVPCHICKLNFKDVLEYTHHCMAKHSESADNSLQTLTEN